LTKISAELNDKSEGFVLIKSSRRVSGHGFLIFLEIKKSEPESGSSDFLAGEIDCGFVRASPEQNALHLILFRNWLRFFSWLVRMADEDMTFFIVIKCGILLWNNILIE
jgi:hypothetical protein